MMESPSMALATVERATLVTRLRRVQSEMNAAGTLAGSGVIAVVLGAFANKGFAISMLLYVGGAAAATYGIRRLVGATRRLNQTREELFLLDRKPQLPEARIVERRDK